MRHHRLIRLSGFRPGHVFWLPLGATWLNRGKPRPFVLATPCSADTTGTLVYGSTRDTEARFGAVRIPVAPVRTGLNRNGLAVTTSFYPGILFRMAYQDLPEHAGSLGMFLAGLRAALRDGLGVGRGSCRREDAPVGSRRGQIVELEPDIAGYLRTRFAVLLTGPEYSRVDNYHVILPIQSGDGFAASHPVLRVERRDWFRLFPGPPGSVLLPIPAVQSVWYPDRIARKTAYVVDEQLLAEIDRALCDYFLLPAPETHG